MEGLKSSECTYQENGSNQAVFRGGNSLPLTHQKIRNSNGYWVLVDNTNGWKKYWDNNQQESVHAFKM